MSGSPLDYFTSRALSVFGHAGSEGYYSRLLEDGVPSATRCRACEHLAFPPRAHCPACLADGVDWVRLDGIGRLYAFTTNKRGLRFTAPQVLAVVEMPELGLVMGPLEGGLDDLEIGQAVRLEQVEVGADLRFHCFVPAEGG